MLLENQKFKSQQVSYFQQPQLLFPCLYDGADTLLILWYKILLILLRQMRRDTASRLT